jgi:hypothetical protein
VRIRAALVASVALVVIAAGCGSSSGDDSSTTSTAVEAATTTTAADAPQNATTVGDPERGRDIWETGGAVIVKPGRTYCHSIDGSELTGDSVRLAPSWLGISERAGHRIPGMSAEDYLRESIVDSSAFIVEGYEDRMHSFRYELNEADLNSLIAFLITL